MSVQMLSHQAELDYKTVQRLVNDPQRNANLDPMPDMLATEVLQHLAFT